MFKEKQTNDLFYITLVANKIPKIDYFALFATCFHKNEFNFSRNAMK